MPEKNEHFCLYLPSSTIVNNGEINLRNNFTVSFCTPIELNQNNDFMYEAALIKIIYPGQFLNIYDGKITYYSFFKEREIELELKRGYYNLPEDFISIFHQALKEDSKYYTIGADSKRNIFILDCISPNNIFPRIRFSPNLAALTGLPGQISQISFSKKNKNGQIEFEPLNPIYTTVCKQIIHSIKIEIRTKLGNFFPFKSIGECLVILHVRPKI